MRGELFFSGRCNFDCFYCIRNEIGVEKTRSDYNRLDEWISLLHKEGVSEVTLSSYNCEPTIQKEFLATVERLFQEGFDLELRTNGVFKYTPEMFSFLNYHFKTIWVSMQALNEHTHKQITGTTRMPNIEWVCKNLPHVDVRVSVVVNRYNRNEVVPVIAWLPNSVKIAQVRKLHTEVEGEGFADDEQAFLDVRDWLNWNFGVLTEEESKYGGVMLGNKKVSFWDDVLEDEIGLKYFPASEIISNAGRIIPVLRGKL